MADQSPAQPKKGDSVQSREGSDGTIGPGSALSNRSLPTPQTRQSRKPSLGPRDPSATMSFAPSELDASGLSATDYSSGEEQETRQRSSTLNTNDAASISHGIRRPSIATGAQSQASITPSAAGKGKRRASNYTKGGESKERGSRNDRDVSRSRRKSRDYNRNDEDEDEISGRYGPMDDEDDEVHHIDRGEQLVRRRMKARQKEKALKLKAEKEKQQLARLQTAQQQQQGVPQPLSPRTRPTSKQLIAPMPASPSPQLEREGRPTHINLPAPDFAASASVPPSAVSSQGPLSPGMRGPINYPSPHSHIRRPGIRASVAEPSGAGRRVSGVSTANYSSTIGAARSPSIPHHGQTGDVFSEAAASEAGTSLREGESVFAEEQDEIRDTIGGLPQNMGIPRSDAGRGEEDLGEEAQPAEEEDEETPNVDGDDDDEGEDTSGDAGDTGSDADVEYTLKDRQDAINIEHPFGLPIWKPALYKKSRSVTRNAENALHSIPSAAAERHLLPANLLWTIFAGLWLSIICFVLAILLNLLPLGGGKYARVIWELGGYLFWPFGKYVECEVGPDSKERLMEYVADEIGNEETNDTATNQAPEDSYENNFTPVAARFPHDHTHTVPFNSRPASSLALTTHDTIRPGDTIAAYRVLEEQKQSSGSGSSREEQQNLNNDESTSTAAGKSYGATKDLEEGMIEYSETERIRQELDIYGYVHDDQGNDVGRAKRILGTIAYGFAFWLIIGPLMGLICLACWGTVFPIPMAKLNWVLLKDLARKPLALRFRSAPRIDTTTVDQSNRNGSESTPLLGHKRSILQQLKAGEPAPQTAKLSRDGRLVRRSRILVCTYRAMGLQYYKYTVGGVNILFINTLPFVFFTIFDFFFVEPYVEHHHLHTGFLALIGSKGAMFIFALGSVIPLSYFIGMAVASISAQSSIGMGAVINATFGSIVEIILYAIALTQDKARLVEGSIVGSILAGVLLMPGVSMCSGAMRRKEQRFNARSAGVTSTMLIMAIIGILTPTLFYQIYGTFQLTCKGCPADTLPGEAWTCKRCFYEHVPPATDPFYQDNVKGLMYTCTVVLVLSYGIGLWFSLRTHASQIWQNPQPQPVLANTATLQNAPGAYPVPNSASQHMAPGQHILHSLAQNANLTQNQRMSMYKRIIPSGVLQQILPTSNNRATSGQSQTVRSNQSRNTIFSEAARDESEHGHGNQAFVPPPLQLPDTLSAEDYERAATAAVATIAVGQQANNPNQGSIRFADGATARMNRKASGQVHDHGSRQGSQAQPLPVSHAGQGQEPPIPQNEAASGGHGGHDAPSWTRGTSLFVLLSCTVLYAIIAEILVDAVDVVLDGSGLDIKLLGVTLFALVPNATEFMNAMSFAINGNIALSMEIGSAYALQVCLIQIPAMVAFSAFYQARGSHDNDINSTFTLIFPRWDVIAIIFAIFLLTYTYIESRSNYFRGSLCLLSYIVLISGFVFAPNTGDPESPVEDRPDLFRALGFGGLQKPILDLPWHTYFEALYNSLWTK
ncbi:uncharacterized protein FA14DRAFT_162088 [Meira miltonrushii]|uniref:Calcium permease n=1 Tax=Meira miltonrushii TaxID=1280837 RepID=A0A316V5S2_9BASI|nr:uncharacterized protein FA14DRAFT_162088 [Meira miltonrushii]PWN32822.1 hypothetical protein FA14DRAFT_162088 [Meira miltonrushii]